MLIVQDEKASVESFLITVMSLIQSPVNMCVSSANLPTTVPCRPPTNVTNGAYSC